LRLRAERRATAGNSLKKSAKLSAQKNTIPEILASSAKSFVTPSRSSRLCGQFLLTFTAKALKGAKETRRLQGHGVNASFEGR